MERLLTGAIEVRGGRKLAGIALPWETRSDSHRERFERDSIELAASGVSFNIGHDAEKVISWTGAGLTVESREGGLYVESDLAEANPVARRAREMVQDGVKGLSIEFRSVREKRDDAGDRVIQAALLSGVALLRNPSYPTAAELRRRRRGGRGRIMPAGVRACHCLDDTDCDSVEFEVDAFNRWAETLASRESDLVAHTGGFSPDKVLASVAAGTLAVSVADNGALEISLAPEVFETPAGRDLADSAPATMPVLRPLIDQEQSEFEDADGVRRYSLPWIQSLLVKTAQDPSGWEALELPPPRPRNRRSALLWL
ncbi:MAG: hypothetical protein F4234_11510 [Gammaproteobacteria bacterium]|nr:hypothetical protein [Gammaproteobacteria bacterium]